uniref:Uncharacterized protein n=1 Tax=Anguilla anguilla TaxID=7936 RepID=A0A0E9VYD9_ANGAN
MKGQRSHRRKNELLNMQCYVLHCNQSVHYNELHQ